MKKLLLSLLLALLVLLVLLAVIAGTSQGLRWLIAGADKVMPGELTAGVVSGSLLGSLELENVRYRDADILVQVDSVGLDWRPGALPGSRVHVRHVRARGIDVQMLKAPEPQPAAPFSLQPLPVTVELRDISLSDISVLEYGATAPVVIDKLHLAATGRDSMLQIQAFSVDAPLYAAKVQGLLYLDSEQAGNISTDWWVQLPDMPRLAGTGTLQGNVRQLEVSQNITGPATVTIEGSVQDVLESLTWNAQVDVSDFNLQVLQPDGPERRVGGTLTGSGGIDAFTVQGNTRMTDPAIGVILADYQLARVSGSWRLERMELRNPQQQGVLRLNGEFTDTGDLSARAEWSDLAWQLDEQQSLRSATGEVVLEGMVDDYRFTSRGVLESTGYPELAFNAQGTGNRQQVTLSQLRGASTRGSFDSSGAVSWQPGVQWQVKAAVDRFDPAFFMPGWPGEVSFRLQSTGSRLEQGLEGRLVVDNVAGTLRDQPLAGSANAEFRHDTLNLADLQFAVGAARLSASGKLDTAWDMQWQLNSKDLGLFLPGATGALQGQGRFTGPREVPHIIAELDGSDIRLQGIGVQLLRAQVDVDLADIQTSAVNIKGTGIEASGQMLESVTLTATGKRPRHVIEFAMHKGGQQVTGRLTAQLDDQRWSGALEELQAQLGDEQSWTAQQPATFTVDRTHAGIQALCMTRDAARLCGAGEWRSTAGWHADLDGDNLPLALFMPWLDENITVDGAAKVELRGRSDGSGLSGSARVDVTPGSITMEDEEETLLLTRFMQGHLTARLQHNVLTGELDLPLQENDGVTGQARFSNVLSRDGWFAGQTAIASDLQLHFTDQGLISLFIPSLSTSRGKMDGDLVISGTLGDPRISGNATLKNAEVSLPQIGLQLKDVNMQVNGAGNTIDLQGSVTSGEGVAAYKGVLMIRQGMPYSMDLSLTGDKVQVVNIPEAMATASPDLKLSLREKRLDITGSVRIPEAQITLREIKGVAKESGDLVLVQQEEVITQADKFQVFSRVNVILDDDVNFNGFGLSGKLAGKVEILEQPGQVTRGQGELNVIDGRYKLYGTELDIEKGRLLFTGGPIDNPGLEIRGVRKTGDVLAGVRISGTAQAPKSSLFSDPSMEQSDVLSYLILGVPTSKASGAQGAALTGAAASLGLTGGDWLASKLGGAFGLEEMRIDSGETMEESSLVLGKYLSPRMYISYAVGLFDQLNTFRIRYSLSKRWAVQTEAGAATGADLLFSMER